MALLRCGFVQVAPERVLSLAEPCAGSPTPSLPLSWGEPRKFFSIVFLWTLAVDFGCRLLLTDSHIPVRARFVLGIPHICHVAGPQTLGSCVLNEKLRALWSPLHLQRPLSHHPHKFRISKGFSLLIPPRLKNYSKVWSQFSLLKTTTKHQSKKKGFYNVLWYQTCCEK